MADRERATLAAGLDRLAIPCSDQQLDALIAYLDVLERWNRAYNLTAIKDRTSWVTRHLLDSLAILPWIGDERVIDVGTGAGLPGVPLAIMRPKAHFALLDSNGKKTRFLFQVTTQLGLGNVEIVESRVETYYPDVVFDAVVSRAFASLSDMVHSCLHLLTSEGRLLALKGAQADAEVTDYGSNNDTDLHCVNIHTLRVPDLHEARSLVELRRHGGSQSAAD